MNIRLLVIFCGIAAIPGCTPPIASTKVSPRGTIEVFEVSLTHVQNARQDVDPTNGFPIWLVTPPIITTADVKSVASSSIKTYGIDGNLTKGTPALDVDLNAVGASKLAAATANPNGMIVAFVVNGLVVSTPKVTVPLASPIQISGSAKFVSTISTLMGTP